MKNRDGLREELAALAHRQWTAWMEYMLKCGEFVNGTWVMPAKNLARWERQMGTEYANLPESEKPLDREQADLYLEVFTQYECDV